MDDTAKKYLRSVNYAGIGIVTLLVVGSGALGVMPLWKKGTADIAAAAQLQTKLAAFSGLSRTMKDMEDKLNKTKESLKEVEERLPSALDPDKFNDELTSVAEKAGIRFESMSPRGDVIDVDGYKAQSYVIEGRGDWDACYKFLTGIRSMKRLTRLDSVDLQVDRQDEKARTSDKPMCHIVIICSTFYMKR